MASCGASVANCGTSVATSCLKRIHIYMKIVSNNCLLRCFSSQLRNNSRLALPKRQVHICCMSYCFVCHCLLNASCSSQLWNKNACIFVYASWRGSVANCETTVATSMTGIYCRKLPPGVLQRLLAKR